MSSGRERLLVDVRGQLGRVVAASTGLDLADKAFTTWVLGRGVSPFDIVPLISSSVDQRSRGYREVAALGFAAEVTSPACEFRSELCEALAWLSKRSTTLCGEIAGFVSDPVGLLGVALGASQCGQPTVEADIAAWIGGVFTARASLPALDLWERCLLAAAAFRVGRATLAGLPVETNAADCRLLLRARGALPQTHPGDASADEASLVTLLLNEDPEQLGYARVVIRAGAFDALKHDIVAAGTVGATTARSSDMTAEPNKSPTKVFVSYSWEDDDPEHQQRVLRFANQLRQYGFNATMDLFEPNPPEGLPMWMLNQIRRSDFVLMVITETYRKRCEDEEKPGKGLGVKWEGGIVTRSIYKAESHHRKFLPVVFGSQHVASIPTILTGNTYYDVSKPQGLEDLVRLISKQPAVVPAPIGQVPHLPPR